jgi:hypothetical protein
MIRCLVIAPGETTVSAFASTQDREASLGAIARHLEEAEARMVALSLLTRHIDEPLQELREIRALIATPATAMELTAAGD